MNETYLIILGFLVGYSIIQCVTGAFSSFASDARSITTLITIGISLILAIFSGILPFGNDVHSISPATNTRVGNELIITSEFPTQIVDNIKFENKPVQVRRIQMHNAWGFEMGNSYSVELVEE